MAAPDTADFSYARGVASCPYVGATHARVGVARLSGGRPRGGSRRGREPARARGVLCASWEHAALESLGKRHRAGARTDRDSAIGLGLWVVGRRLWRRATR